MTTLDLRFRRLSDTPLLDTRAVPWCLEEARPRPTVIFPTVVDSAAYKDVLPRPLDRFYMYYAPHHSHGIGLASAPHPEGPWTAFAGNPIFRLEDVPGLRGHISSPELVYRPDHPEAAFWLYFHGQALPPGGGQQTCLATSPDGLRWSLYAPEPVLTATAEQTSDHHTAAYVRVFRIGRWWYGLYKAEKAHGLARSSDGISWEHWPHNPVIRPEAAASEYDRIRHTGIVVQDGMLFILYSTLTRPDLSREEITLATLPVADDDWTRWGPLHRHGVVLTPEHEWEAGDLRDPFILRHDDSLYLFYTGGHEQGIGLAKTCTDALTHISLAAQTG
ncbi:MAG: hypothetical protein HY332_21020 [Chloroflexi bacterium]|nr:hypothetical protein [Chloroflexota bacterium]